MKNYTTFQFVSHPVKERGEKLYLIPVFQDQEALSILKLVKKSDLVPVIKENIRIGAFKASPQEFLSLANQGIILGGLGKEENFHPDKLMALMRSFSAKVKSLEHVNIHIVFNHELRDAVERFNRIASGEESPPLDISAENAQRAFFPGKDSADEEDVPPDFYCAYTQEEAISQMVSSFIIGSTTMGLLKTDEKGNIKSSKKNPKRPSTKLIGFIAPQLKENQLKEAIERGQILGETVNESRRLASLPGNFLNPDQFEIKAKELAKENGLKIKIFNQSKLSSLGCGGILSVGKGSGIPPRMIVVEYKPAVQKKVPCIVMVGKGITFDTGGISLKSPGDMHEMKYDMCGAATVLNAVAMIKKRKLPVEVIGLLGIAENMPDGNAIKPGDVYTAYNGITVEIQNTDAEGRLVLGDVLSYACKNYNPDYLVDFATLTGACVVALGHEAAGIMTPSDSFAALIEKASRKSLDKTWRLPHWYQYGMPLKSDIADMRNITGRNGGTVGAMRFLSAFVTPGLPWAHFDIAGTAWRGKSSGTQPKGATGWGIRMLNQLIEDILEKN